MKKIKKGDRVRYVGKSNRWTYKQDLEKNNLGTVIMVLETDSKKHYQVEFDNNITTTIDFEDIQLL